MDMEWEGSRYEDGEVASLENGSPGEVYKEEKMNDLEENGVDMENDHKQDNGGSSVAKDKEKSRESGKHRSKDRKKGRREEKDHKSKDRERSKERDKTHDVSKEKGDKEQELRDKDRISSRERRKEEIEVHNKDKEKSRDKTREKDHDRDKFREKDRERDKDREREHERGKERDRDRELEKERSLEQEFERGKERARDREKDYERNKGRERDREKVDKEWERERGKEKDREREKDKDREREKERDRGKEREREKEKGKDRDREKEKGKDRDREREKERDKDWDRLEREKGKEKSKEKEKEKDRDKNWEKDRDKERGKDRERDKVSGRNQDEGYGKEMVRGKEREKDEKLKVDYVDNRDVVEQGKEIQNNEVDTHDRGGTKDQKLKTERAFDGSHSSTSKLQDRIKKMKEERLKKKSEGVSEVLAWVSKSRKLEEKIISEKEKALHISKAFEEQDRVDQGDSEDEDGPQHIGKNLAGVKVLHGLDKVIEGGAVVLTLKDQNILADGDINEEIDVLENVEIGEQKQRDGAYSAAKKKARIYTDKFNDDPGSQKRMLPQYDDPVEDEGVTLDESGQFTGKAEKKLEELRKRLQGSSTSTHFEDLTSSGKTSSDYYTHEEMLQFKKPKKKKSLRKKEKLDLDALEAEAISAGLGAGDLGSRNEGKRQAAKEEQENADAEMRSNAYKAAYAKAEEASKALRHEQTLTIKDEEDDSFVFGDVDDDLYRSVEKARKLALKRQDETAASGPQAVALLAVADNETEESQNPVSGDPQEKRLVFTEMEEFVSKIKLDEDVHKPETENVFEEDDDAPKSFDQEKDEGGGWMEVNEIANDELPVNEEKEDLVPDTAIHEPAVGKGLSGALQLLKERGTLKETVDWGGRNMDKKKSKLVGIYDNDGQKEIRIERTDEFGRIMTPKEAFRMISHKFHGKGPGKMKLEKRMKQYHEELKLKQMKASDTPSQSMERMREAQARLKTPYLVLSGHVKPGQTSDPRSGFATVEKDHPGSLTPMLGDRKVEHFLGLKRKAEPGDMGPPKKPKT